MNIKKLIASVFALSLGVVTNLASANTNYDFTATFSNNGPSFNNNNYTLNGVATVDETTFITTISSLYENGVAVTPFSPSGRIASPGTGYGYQNFTQIGSPDFAFNVSYRSYLYPDINTGGKLATASFQSLSNTNVSMPDGYGTGYGRTTVSLSTVAPEMNASLIPQVGLLLVCLFFMFGRRKEKTEPLLTA
jgi:hypothetical protein